MLQVLGPQFPESGGISRRENVSLFIQFLKAAITAFSSSHCWTKLKATVVLVMILTVRAATMGVHKGGWNRAQLLHM